MKKVLLLRSFGDFVIALYHLPSNNVDKEISLVASKHLADLHKALYPYLSDVQRSVRFIDIGIQHQILSGFTDRYIFSAGNVKELALLNRNLKSLLDSNQPHYCLEQKRRSWLIKLACEGNFLTVHEQGNIYDSWAQFFNHRTKATANAEAGKNVLIFPDSRLVRKEIPETVLYELEKKLIQEGKQVTRAYFKVAKSSSAKCYQNFEELIALIEKSDFVISSDSLPAHIAQLLQKPHAILYAKKINHEWVTPFAQSHHLAFTFAEVNKISF